MFLQPPPINSQDINDEGEMMMIVMVMKVQWPQSEANRCHCIQHVRTEERLSLFSRCHHLNHIDTHTHTHIFASTQSAHTVYLCVLCGSQNKQRLFPYTALTGWFL